MYYGLVLSMMRDEKIENSDRLVCWSEKREYLEEFVAHYKVDPWVDENPGMANLNGTSTYHKVFAKNSPLEWFNAFSHQYDDNFIIPLENPTEFSNRMMREAPPEVVEQFGGDLERIRQTAYAAREDLLTFHVKIGPKFEYAERPL